MSDQRYIDKLTMPQSAMDAMAKAVPDVVRAIVGDHYKRAAPTPPAPKNIVDSLLEKFAVVAPFAARTEAPPPVAAITATLRLTRSAASGGSRSL